MLGDPRNPAEPSRSCEPHWYSLRVLILVIVLVVIWLILSIVGFAVKGLFWLGIIGIVLVLATILIGIVRRAANKAKNS